MPPRNNQQKDIQSKELLLVESTSNQERGTKIDLRVVDWIVNNKHYPQLEKREFFIDQNSGDWKMGKAKGFTMRDLVKVQDQWGEIMAALGGSSAATSVTKPESAPAPAAPAPAAPAEDF